MRFAEIPGEEADALAAEYRKQGRFLPTVVAVVVANGLVLVVNQHGVWGLPQGGIEKGEPVCQAGRREIGEETGLDPTGLVVVAYLSPQEIPYPPGRNPRGGFKIGKVYFPCVMAAGSGLNLNPNYEEVQGADWFSLEKAKQLCATDPSQAHKVHLVLAIFAFIDANSSRIKGRR